MTEKAGATQRLFACKYWLEVTLGANFKTVSHKEPLFASPSEMEAGASLKSG